MNFRSKLAVTACCLVVAPLPAFAQLEEITVTARKTSESLQTAPLSITAFTGMQMEEHGINNLQDLQLFTPGMSFFSFGNRAYGQITFRGMNNANILDPTTENASLFIDGVYYPGAIPSVSLEDLGRAEVIKGPQSAMFGRATFSGAINLISNEPTDTFTGRIKAEAATYKEYKLSANLSGPLVADKLKGTLFVSGHTFGGDYKNQTGDGRIGKQKDLFTSARLVFTPSDTLRVSGRVNYVKTRDGLARRQLIGAAQHNCGPFGGTNRGGLTTYYCGPANFDPNTIALNGRFPQAAKTALGHPDFKDGLERSFWHGSVMIDWDIFGEHTLSSLTGYSKEKYLVALDSDHSAIDQQYNWQDSNTSVWSQELRLTSPTGQRLGYSFGGSYFYQDRIFSSLFVAGPRDPDVLRGIRQPGFFGPPVPRGGQIKNHSVFGSANYNITDQLNLSVEGRWQRDQQDTIQVGGLPLILVTKSFLPRFILDYKPTDDLTFYFNAAKGNKPTQANVQVSQTTPARQQVLRDLFRLEYVAPEETAWTYEVGAKTRLWDNRVTFNLAAYMIKWKGKQGRVLVSYDFNGNGVIDATLTGVDRESFGGSLVSNGNARNIGLEAVVQAQLTDQWTVGASGSILDNKFDKFRDEVYNDLFGTYNIGDKVEPRVARWNATLTTSYRAPLNETYEWFVSADATFTGRRYDYLWNLAYSAAKTTVNMQVGIESGDLTLTLFGKNIFDNLIPNSVERTSQTVVNVSPAGAVTTRSAYAITGDLANRRQFGIRAAYKF